jgi:hypothetical protein
MREFDVSSSEKGENGTTGPDLETQSSEKTPDPIGKSLEANLALADYREAEPTNAALLSPTCQQAWKARLLKVR